MHVNGNYRIKSCRTHFFLKRVKYTSNFKLRFDLFSIEIWLPFIHIATIILCSHCANVSFMHVLAYFLVFCFFCIRQKTKQKKKKKQEWCWQGLHLVVFFSFLFFLLMTLLSQTAEVVVCIHQ